MGASGRSPVPESIRTVMPGIAGSVSTCRPRESGSPTVHVIVHKDDVQSGGDLKWVPLGYVAMVMDAEIFFARLTRRARAGRVPIRFAAVQRNSQKADPSPLSLNSLRTQAEDHGPRRKPCERGGAITFQSSTCGMFNVRRLASTCRSLVCGKY